MSGSGSIWERYAQVVDACGQPRFNSENPHFGNSFANLAECLRVVREACAKVGDCAVAFDTAFEAGRITVYTLMLGDGVSIRLAPVPFIDPNDNMKRGAALTYAKRQSLCAAFALAAEEDDDGVTADMAESRQEHVSGRSRAGNVRKPGDGGDAPEKSLKRRLFETMTVVAESMGVTFDEVRARIEDERGKPMTEWTDEEYQMKLTDLEAQVR